MPIPLDQRAGAALGAFAAIRLVCAVASVIALLNRIVARVVGGMSRVLMYLGVVCAVRRVSVATYVGSMSMLALMEMAASVPVMVPMDGRPMVAVPARVLYVTDMTDVVAVRSMPARTYM